MRNKKIIIRKKGGKLNLGVRRFQEGGQMPQEQTQEMQTTEANPQQQLQDMLTQYAESRSPEVAVMIADMILEEYMQSQQPAEAAPAPTEDMPEGEPMGRYGMSMRSIKRKK